MRAPMMQALSRSRKPGARLLVIDLSGVTQIAGQGAAFHVRSDASNVNMTFNGCQIGVACGTGGGPGSMDSELLIDHLDEAGAGQPSNELDLTNKVNDESLEDKRRKRLLGLIGALR